MLTLRKNKDTELTYDEMDMNLIHLATSFLTQHGYNVQLVEDIRLHILNGFPSPFNPLTSAQMFVFGSVGYGYLSVNPEFNDVLVTIKNVTDSVDFSFEFFAFDSVGIPYEISASNEFVEDPNYFVENFHFSNLSTDKILIIYNNVSNFVEATSALDIE